MMSDSRFNKWLARWKLVQDGEAIAIGRSSSLLLPVLCDGAPAMLKIAVDEEETRGGAMMDWYAGCGAAKVLAHDGPALLLERLAGQRDLSTMARSGQDDEATGIICSVVAKLHAPRAQVSPESLVPMQIWFRQLDPAALRYGGILTTCATAARDLLAQPQNIVPLHGDIHHGNILDGGERGWLAIDPKGVLGERGFDYANLFRNPEACFAGEPGRLQRRVEIVARAARLEPKRLLTWILAYAGLGAAWTMDSGGQDEAGLAIARIAATELGA
ncbi:MAG TPA: aminoglycoside phosphotransferase family protein [Rhizomicrobium sp.]|nr:aminoglycoside phosphotransferase family protein [Rhizomicrobium sp.]